MRENRRVRRLNTFDDDVQFKDNSPQNAQFQTRKYMIVKWRSTFEWAPARRLRLPLNSMAAERLCNGGLEWVRYTANRQTDELMCEMNPYLSRQKAVAFGRIA
jgi:hypothetical protein